MRPRETHGPSPIDRELKALRPPDPSAAEVEAATSRVLARFATRLDTIEDALREVRPENPSEAEAHHTATRVLARVAMRTSGAEVEPAPAPRAPRRLAPVLVRVAAALVAAVVLTQIVGYRPLEDGTSTTTTLRPHRRLLRSPRATASPSAWRKRSKATSSRASVC